MKFILVDLKISWIFILRRAGKLKIGKGKRGSTCERKEVYFFLSDRYDTVNTEFVLPYVTERLTTCYFQCPSLELTAL